MKVARANRPLRDVLARSSARQRLGPKSFLPSVHEALQRKAAERGR